MQLQDLLESVRSRLADPTTNRYTNADLTSRINEAQVILANELQWPRATISVTTIAGQQVYALPQNSGILSVSIAGQRIMATTEDSLVGAQINYYDPSNNGMPYYSTEPPNTYPSLVPYGAGANANVPWYPGQRPRYFLLDEPSLTNPDASGPGPQIAFIPPPAGVYPVLVRCIANPTPLVNLTDYVVFPEICKMALVWWVVAQEEFADDHDARAMQVQGWYQEALSRARRWVAGQLSELQHAPQFLPSRSYFSRRRRGC